MRSLSPRYLFLLSFAVAAVQSGCERSSNQNTGPLPTPKLEEIKASDYQPQNPFVQSSPGVLSRTVFVAETAPATPYHVDVQDLLIAPNQQPVEIPHAGTAVFEVRGGSGTATAGEKAQELTEGATFSVADGVPLKLAVKGEMAVTLRAYVIRMP
jgi:hypothetical protein